MKPIRSPFYLLLACTAVLYSQYNPICGLPYIAGQTWNGPVQLKKSMQDNPVNREFKIRKDILNITYDPIEIDCRLLYEDSSFLIYGEAAQIDSGNIDTVAVNSLVTWFRDSTAAGSIAPDQGIKAIADSIFGPPPDIDGNGQVFILLIDVRDNFDPDTSQNFVAGYFDPADQGYGGNYADIIYLDTDPGRITGSHTSLLMSTLAHEYQHLIHYGRDPREDDWLNEGLSELSPVLMGLPHRNFTHYLADTNVRLDKFDNELADYARCGLFFLYTWWEFGTPLIQDIVRDTEDGILSVDKQLSAQGGPTIDEFVLEWHLANMLPSDYSYTRQYTIPQPALHTVINSYPHEASIDVARLGAHWSVINAGASLYMKSTDAGPNDDVQLLLIREPDHSFIDAPQLDVVGYLDTTFGIDYSGLLILATTGSSVATTAQYGLFASATGGYREELLSFDEDREVDKFILLGDEEFTGAAAIRF
ncbi:MAG: hypothetical protein KAU50_03480, partial [Candidatus Marinimicrobia bacterium]|nr:hypothetical protein [Candidatus Neomarinimicrobiota bacterium]